jgi:hypothetical protein
MVKNWHEAKESAEKKECELVFHDWDTGEFGACRPGERQGHFDGGRFVEHRCICMPARLDSKELAAKEKIFLEENPDWAGTE